MAKPPLQKAVELCQAFHEASASDDVFFHAFMQGRVRSPACALSFAALSENAKALSHLFHDVFAVSDDPKLSAARDATAAGSAGHAPDVAESERKVLRLWDAVLAGTRGGSGDAFAPPSEVRTTEALPCNATFAVPACLYNYIRTSAMLECTSSSTAYTVLLQCDGENATRAFGELVSQFLSAALDLANLLQGMSGASAGDGGDGGLSKDQQRLAWAALREHLAPRSARESLPPASLVNVVVPNKVFFLETQVMMESLLREVRSVFFPETADGSNTAATDAPADPLNYFLILDVVKKTLQGEKANKADVEGEASRGADDEPDPFTGVAACVVRGAYLSVVDFVDRCLFGAEGTPSVAAAGAADRHTVRARVAAVLEAAADSRPATAGSGGDEDDLLPDISPEDVVGGLGDSDAGAATGGAPSGKAESVMGDEDDGAALDAYLRRREQLTALVAERCLSFAQCDAFVQMAHQEDLPSELFKKLSVNGLSGCAAHSSTQTLSAAANPRCSRCLLRRWLPHLSPEAEAAVVEDNYAVMNDALQAALTNGIELAVRRVVNVREHLDAVAEMSRCAKTVAALEADIERYVATHTTGLLEWARAKVVAYGAAEVQLLRDREAARQQRARPQPEEPVLLYSPTHYKRHDVTHGSGLTSTVFQCRNVRLSDIVGDVEGVMREKKPAQHVVLLVEGWLTVDTNLTLPGRLLCVVAERVFVVDGAKRVGPAGKGMEDVFVWSTKAARGGYDGEDGKDACRYTQRDPTALDGKSGGDGESGTHGRNGGDISIRTTSPFQFGGAATKLRFVMDGSDGGMGGRAGNGANGGSVANQDDSTLQGAPSVNRKWFGLNSFSYALQGRYAAAMPGRGGCSGLRGVRGLRGKGGTLHVTPPIPGGSARYETSGRAGQDGKDGAAGVPGDAGGGGCDGKSVVLNRCIEGVFGFATSSRDYDSFYATADFDAHRVVYGVTDPRYYSCWSTQNWTKRGLYPYAQYVLRRSVNLAHEFVNRGVYYTRARLNGARQENCTSMCEAATENLSADQVLESNALIAELVTNILGSLRASAKVEEDEEEDERFSAERSLFEISETLLAALNRRLGVVHELLQYDLWELPAKLQLAGTLEEVLVNLQGNPAQRVNVALNFCARDEQAASSLGPAPAEDAADGEAGAPTLTSVFRDLGSRDKKSVKLPLLPLSHLLSDSLRAVKRYNANARLVQRGEGNVLHCLAQLSAAIAQMHSSALRVIREYAASLYRSMLLKLKSCLLSLKGSVLISEFLAYVSMGGEKKSYVHPCLDPYFGALVFRALAFHHARSTAVSLSQQLGTSVIGRQKLSRCREEAEELLACPACDVAAKLRGSTGADAVGGSAGAPAFALYGPLLLPPASGTEPPADALKASSHTAYARLVQLHTVAFGKARFPVSEVALLDSVCRDYCSQWSTFTFTAPATGDTLRWVCSQTNVETYRFLASCASSLSEKDRLLHSGVHDLSAVPFLVKTLLEADGDVVNLVMRRVQLEVLARWREYLKPTATRFSRARTSFVSLVYRVLQRSLLLHASSPDEEHEAALHGMMLELFVLVDEVDCTDSGDAALDFAALTADQLWDVAKRAQERQAAYVALLAVDEVALPRYTSAAGVNCAMYVSEEVSQLWRSFLDYLHVKVVLSGAVEATCQFYLAGDKEVVQRADAKCVDCDACGYSVKQHEEGAARGASVPFVPCVRCGQSGSLGRRAANELSYLRLLLAYAPRLAVTLARHPGDCSAGGGGAALQMCPHTVAELLWRGCGAAHQAEASVAARESRVRFQTLVDHTEDSQLCEFLGAAAGFLSASRLLPSHEPFDAAQGPARGPGAALPVRACPHNGSRLVRFLRLACDDATEASACVEKVAALVRTCGEGAVHERLSTWAELLHVDRYHDGCFVPFMLTSSCIEKLDRWTMEEELRRFAARFYSDTQRVVHRLDEAVHKFSGSASTPAMRLVAHQLKQEVERAGVEDAQHANAAAPIYPELFRCVLLVLCAVPVELDDDLIGQMVALPLNEWMPDLSRLVHCARLYAWAPWLHEVGELCWALALGVGEQRLPDYYTLLRSVVEADYCAESHYRLLVLLETPDSLCLPEEKLRLALHTEPCTWRSEVERLRGERTSRRVRSRDVFGNADAQKKFIAEFELGWDAIGEYLSAHGTPISAETLHFCDAVHEEVHSTLARHSVTDAEVVLRFKRFNKEYSANYYANKQRRQRASLSEVQKRDQLLWCNKEKLREVLVTVFLAFYQGKFKPRRVQVLSVVALLSDAKSCLANINTAEGKTFICGCFAAVKAYVGYTPLLLSCNDALAKEGCSQHKAALQLLFMNAADATAPSQSFGCHVDPDETAPAARGRFYTHAMLYTTLFSLIGDQLRSRQQPTAWRSLQRLMECPIWVVLDEADIVMVGSVSDAVYIGTPQLAFYKEILAFPALLDAVRRGEPPDTTYKSYYESLLALCTSDEDPSLRRDRFDVLHHSAAEACGVQSDAEFVAADSTTHPYDKLTGSVQVGSVWRNNVQVHLNIKEGGRFTPEDNVSLSMAALTFLRTAKASLTGVTGTAGNYLTRVMYRNVYELETWELPPAFPSQLLECFPRVAFCEEAFRDLTCQSVRLFMDGGQSCLCVQDTVRETKKLVKLFEKQFPEVPRSSYVSEKDARPQLGGSGKSAIICATQRGGRGLDIAINHANGLAELLLSPQEERNTHQAERRAARQYDNGCAIRIFLDLQHRHPLPHERFDDCLFSVHTDHDGYYTGTDNDILHKQAIMLNAFYEVQNDAVMRERRRLCRLVDRSIPVTLFFDALQTEMTRTKGRVGEVFAPLTGDGGAAACAVQRVVQRRYVQWLADNEEKINQDGNRPREQAKYMADLQRHLKVAVPDVEKGPEKRAAWAVAATVARDEDDLIEGAQALSFDPKRLGPLFTVMAGRVAPMVKEAWAYPTVPLYLALEAARDGRWKTQAQVDSLRTHLSACKESLGVMGTAYSNLVERVKKTQLDFDVRCDPSKGTVKQLFEWVAFTEDATTHLSSLIGTTGVVYFESLAYVRNPDAPCSSKKTMDTARLLLKHGVLEWNEKNVRGAPADGDAALVAELEEALSFPAGAFGEGSESFATRFVKELRKPGETGTTALLAVLVSAFPNARDVSTHFGRAAHKGLVGNLRVGQKIFHMHDEDYAYEAEKRLKGTALESYSLSVASLAAQCVGQLRADQVNAVSAVALVSVVDRLKENTALLAPFVPLGLHHTLSIKRREHCPRVEEEIRREKEEERRNNSWWRKAWRGVKAVFRFVGKVLAASGLDTLLQYCFPVLKVIRLGLDCVKCVCNLVVSKIKTGAFQVGQHLMALGQSVAMKLLPRVVSSVSKWVGGLEGMTAFMDTRFMKEGRRLFSAAKEKVDQVSSAIGKVTSKLNNAAVQVSDALGVTSGVLKVSTFLDSHVGDLLPSLTSQAVKTAFVDAVKSNATQLLIDNASSYAVEKLTTRLADTSVDDAMKRVADELTEEVLILTRAVKRKGSDATYETFRRRLLHELEDGGFCAALRSLLTGLVNAGKYELLSSFAASGERTAEGEHVFKAGQRTTLAMLNVVTSISSVVTASNLLFGSTKAKAAVARRKMKELLCAQWTWAEKHCGVNEAEARATAVVSPVAADEVALVNAISAAVKEKCLQQVRNMFADVVGYAVEVVRSTEMDAQQQLKERQLRLSETAAMERRFVLSLPDSGFATASKHPGVHGNRVPGAPWMLEPLSLQLWKIDFSKEPVYMSGVLFSVGEDWRTDDSADFFQWLLTRGKSRSVDYLPCIPPSFFVAQTPEKAATAAAEGGASRETDGKPKKPSSQRADAKPEKPSSQQADAKPEKPSSQQADAKPEKPSSQQADAKPEKPSSQSLQCVVAPKEKAVNSDSLCMRGLRKTGDAVVWLQEMDDAGGRFIGKIFWLEVNPSTVISLAVPFCQGYSAVKKLNYGRKYLSWCFFKKATQAAVKETVKDGVYTAVKDRAYTAAENAVFDVVAKQLSSEDQARVKALRNVAHKVKRLKNVNDKVKDVRQEIKKTSQLSQKTFRDRGKRDHFGTTTITQKSKVDQRFSAKNVESSTEINNHGYAQGTKALLGAGKILAKNQLKAMAPSKQQTTKASNAASTPCSTAEAQSTAPQQSSSATAPSTQCTQPQSSSVAETNTESSETAQSIPNGEL